MKFKEFCKDKADLKILIILLDINSDIEFIDAISIIDCIEFAQFLKKYQPAA